MKGEGLYLLDTSAWILVLRKRFLPVLRARVDQLLAEDVVLTTGMVRLELLSGTRTLEEFERLKNRLEGLQSQDTDHQVWEQAFRLSFDLRRKGVTVPSTDLLIAATALRAKATVIHVDSHFDLISKHSGLPVESYVRSAKKAGFS